MKLLKTILIILILILAGLGYWTYLKYQEIYSANITVSEEKGGYLYIRTGSTLEDVIHQLIEQNIIHDRASFEWVSKLKKYDKHIHPGKYKINNGMSNNDLINLLRSGKQEPVNVTLYLIHTKEQLASKASQKLEADSAELLRLLNNEQFLVLHNLTKETVLSLFLPNTYQFFWNTSAEKFIKRMEREYKRFWNDKRINRAKQIGFTPLEVITLASIVEQETLMAREKPTVAGVYMNRLRKGMKLEADPTVIFAIGDFTKQRVLHADKEIDSPYNTYKYTGLPPGPIVVPSAASIDAVLNYEKHEYLYFCAKEDFSGYHNFAKHYAQHILNAIRFRKELDRRGIKK